MSDTTQNTSNLDKLFKYKYDKRSFALFNTATALLSKTKKVYDFSGKSLVLDAVLGFGGGVGSGTLPETNVYQQENATMTRKKLYSRILLDREAIIASKGNDAAFEQVTKRAVRKGVESFTRNLSRQLFAFENGLVFEGDNSTNVLVSGSDYTFVASATGWCSSFLEKKDYLDSYSSAGNAETALWEVKSVTPATRTVVLTLVSGSTAATNGAATDLHFYMQNSKGNDIESILGVCKATTSSKYGIDIGNRWQAAQVNANSAGITSDLINQVVTDIEFNTGESPDLIVTSHKQIRKLKNLLADKLRYCPVSPRDPVFKKAGVSFQGIEFNSDAGAVPIVADRMCPDGYLFALNTDYIELHMAEAPKWFDEDGTVLMRSASADSYEARYGLYGDIFVHPHAHGVLYDLA